MPAPFVAAYSASKFGLRGLSGALRAEFAFSRGIHICDVYPSFIDTRGVFSTAPTNPAARSWAAAALAVGAGLAALLLIPRAARGDCR